MTPIDDLIRESLTVPEDDSVERAGLIKARAALDAVASQRAPRRLRRLSAKRASAAMGYAAVVGCVLLVLVIAIGAVVLVRHQSGKRSVSTAANGRTAGLLADLSVLRGSQTEADRLPANVVQQWPRFANTGDVGRLLASSTRLVDVEGEDRLYLAITTPVTENRWTDAEGDQVTIVLVTPSRVAFTPPIPARALHDADIVGPPYNPFGNTTARSQAALAAELVGVIPDGVAKARWNLGTRRKPDFVNVKVHDNLAVLPGAGRRIVSEGLWYDAAGGAVQTDDAVVGQGEEAFEQTRYEHALTAAERQGAKASPQILKAFSVFSYTNLRGTRLSDGYTISKPPITDLPLGVIALPEESRQLDFQETREVQSPSGLIMYIVPGARSLCVFEIGRFENDQPPVSQAGAGGSCDPTLSHVLEHGSGVNSGGPHGITTFYGVLPTAHPTTSITFQGHTRHIHPLDGIYIIRG